MHACTFFDYTTLAIKQNTKNVGYNSGLFRVDVLAYLTTGWPGPDKRMRGCHQKLQQPKCAATKRYSKS